MHTRYLAMIVFETDGAHGCDMAASARRVGTCVRRIIAARPLSGADLLRLLLRLEGEIDGVTMPEIEYASYLAGMAERQR